MTSPRKGTETRFRCYRNRLQRDYLFEMTSPRKGTETACTASGTGAAPIPFEMTSPRKGTETIFLLSEKSFRGGLK